MMTYEFLLFFGPVRSGQAGSLSLLLLFLCKVFYSEVPLLFSFSPFLFCSLHILSAPLVLVLYKHKRKYSSLAVYF
jgi:hypothetical protein